MFHGNRRKCQFCVIIFSLFGNKIQFIVKPDGTFYLKLVMMFMFEVIPKSVLQHFVFYTKYYLFFSIFLG